MKKMSEVDLTKILALVEIIDGTEVRVKWARRFINEDGTEETSWHRASYNINDSKPVEVEDAIINGSAISKGRRRSSSDDAADFLSGLN